MKFQVVEDSYVDFSIMCQWQMRATIQSVGFQVGSNVNAISYLCMHASAYLLRICIYTPHSSITFTGKLERVSDCKMHNDITPNLKSSVLCRVFFLGGSPIR